MNFAQSFHTRNSRGRKECVARFKRKVEWGCNQLRGRKDCVGLFKRKVEWEVTNQEEGMYVLFVSRGEWNEFVPILFFQEERNECIAYFKRIEEWCVVCFKRKEEWVCPFQEEWCVTRCKRKKNEYATISRGERNDVFPIARGERNESNRFKKRNEALRSDIPHRHFKRMEWPYMTIKRRKEWV